MTSLFLEPLYLVVVIVSGILVGLIFDQMANFYILRSSFILIFLFSIGQIIFRIVLEAEPLRLVGQLVYYIIFLFSILLANRLRDKFL